MYADKLLNELPVMVYVTEPDGLTGTFFNRTWFEFTGLSEDDIADTWHRLVDPRDVERIGDHIKLAVANNEPYEVEFRLKCKDNSHRWCLSKANPVFDSNGKLVSYVGTTMDIHDRKIAIRDMEEAYELVLQKRLDKIKKLEEELKIHRTT